MSSYLGLLAIKSNLPPYKLHKFFYLSVNKGRDNLLISTATNYNLVIYIVLIYLNSHIQ
jgi:hypothetical protein